MQFPQDREPHLIAPGPDALLFGAGVGGYKLQSFWFSGSRSLVGE